MLDMKSSNTTSDTAATPAALGAIASQVNALLDQVEALIPDYTQPDPERVPKVSANARFAHELIAPTITAVGNYEPLRQHNLFDVEGGRHALAVRDELRPLALRTAAIAAALQFTIDSKLAAAAAETLQTYQWSKRHAEEPAGAALRPYVAEMRRVVAKTINRRPAKAANASDTPARQSFVAELPADGAHDGQK